MLLAGTLDAGQTTSSPAGPAGIFVFDHPFWLNLHQFLYVLGRAEIKTSDAQRRAVVEAPRDQAEGLTALNEGEQRAWQTAVSFYAKGPSRKDVLFDGELVDFGRLLVAAGDRPSLDSVGADPAMVDTLRRAEALYRKAWWPQHDRANRALIDRLNVGIGQHGESMRAFITRAYREKWPQSGFPVHISAYANWAGAFSTSAGVLIVSSLDTSSDGLKGLETIFHEAMHQWDDPIYAALSSEARRQGTVVPDNLSHAMIFFTAGQAVRSVSPGRVPVAESEGIWTRSLGVFKPALETAWQPYLEGRGTRDEAIAALIKALPR